MYKYEMHMHTDEVSYCGQVPAAEQVRRYAALGYSGVCVTDHLHSLYLMEQGDGTDWQKYMDYHMRGFYLAKEEGEKLGIDVILGAELRFPENDRDYLIFGIDEQWLRNHPFICEMDHRAFFEKYKEEVLIIHAHPFRYNDEVAYDCVHGLEIANGNPRHNSRNELALALAEAHPELIRVVGSDAHRDGDEGHCALLFSERIPDSHAFRNALLRGQFKLWAPDFPDILEQNDRNLAVRA